ACAVVASDRESLRFHQRFERAHRGMQTEEAVEIDRLSLWNSDRGPQLVIVRFAKRHDHVQSINCAALKDRDQRLSFTARARIAERNALEKRRRGKRHTNTGECDAA